MWVVCPLLLEIEHPQKSDLTDRECMYIAAWVMHCLSKILLGEFRVDLLVDSLIC